MRYTIYYARVGNAEPVYSVMDDDGETQIASSVDGVGLITKRSRRSVQLACREARELGFSEFLA